MRIFKEKAGVISEAPVWVCIARGYLCVKDTLVGLLWTLFIEWRNDKHLAGY